uniref:Uncharacterized protein n=1 Tax=Solanum tuberosum TaxID=4113 RepID=M1DEG3_SOLTU
MKPFGTSSLQNRPKLRAKNKKICAAADHSVLLVRIADQLGDLPRGVVHRRLAPFFSIVVLWVIGRHGTASRNFSAMRRLAPTRQVDPAILRPSFLRSFHFFLRCSVHAFLQTSNT